MAYKASKRVLAAVLGGGALVGVAGMGAVATGPGIGREGDSAHREALSALETTPFPVELFGGLDNWTLGAVLDSETIKDKVVLIGIVAIDDPQSMMTLSSLARYERQNADKGLVALAVHPETDWDVINEKVQAGRVKVQVARDVGGAFVSGVHSDDYPDLYLIDRAGQLRYADIESRSLKAAVSGLLRESSEDAIANALAQAQGIEIAVDEEQAEEKSREIAPALYAQAAWPSVNSGKLNAQDYQGKPLPVPLGNEEWITKPVETDGKVVVLDFWATWCGPCRRASPMLDEMQVKYRDQLAVLAIGGQNEDEGKVRKYVIQKKNAYSHLFDSKQSIYRELKIRAIPHTVIMSTDGVIRWQGNPLSPSFKTALEQVISVDPMLAED